MARTQMPQTSLLHQSGVRFDFTDSYAAPIERSELAIEDVARAFFSSSPAWVDRLLLLRDRMMGVFGLKVANTRMADRRRLIDEFMCNVGDEMALFKVFAKNENEVILGEDDKHLDFRVSLFLDRVKAALLVSTIVQFNHWSGRLYFFPVKPFHKIIVPAMLRAMVKYLQKN